MRSKKYRDVVELPATAAASHGLEHFLGVGGALS
jgi:hypothetical protein